MSTILILSLALAATPADGTPESYKSESAALDERSDLRIAQDLRRSVSDGLRREATTEGRENQAAIYNLLAIYDEVVRDRTLTKDERKRLRGKLRSRLMRVEKRIAREVERAREAAEREARRGGKPPQPALKNYISGQLNQLGQGIARGGAALDPAEALLELIQETIQPGSWNDQGGPGVIRIWPRYGSLQRRANRVADAAAFVARGALGGAPDDDGQLLIELIQATIAPKSWDVVGGPGTIFYYRPLRVMVIRQTGEVHGGVADALGQLRAVGN